jgi:hypothetical protein
MKYQRKKLEGISTGYEIMVKMVILEYLILEIINLLLIYSFPACTSFIHIISSRS